VTTLPPVTSIVPPPRSVAIALALLPEVVMFTSEIVAGRFNDALQ